MNHQEKVKQKREAYVNAGFECTLPNIEETKSSFISVKDGLRRLHVFTDNEMTVELIADVVAAAKTDAVTIEVEPKKVVAEPKKKITKKKKGV